MPVLPITTKEEVDGKDWRARWLLAARRGSVFLKCRCRGDSKEKRSLREGAS